MLRITSERTLYTDKETCAFFIDWQKAYGPVKWTKLMWRLEEELDNCAVCHGFHSP